MFVSLTIILSLTPLSNVCIPPLQYLLSSQLHLTCYKFIIIAWHWLQLLMVPSRSCIHWSLLINYYCMCVSHPSLLNPAFLGQSLLISPTHPLLHVHPTPLGQSIYLISPYSSPATSWHPLVSPYQYIPLLLYQVLHPLVSPYYNLLHPALVSRIPLA